MTGVTKNKSFYDEKRIRRGKTQKDRDSGAFKRNEDNKIARGNWNREAKGKMTRSCPGGGGVGEFPLYTTSTKPSKKA